MGGEDQFLFEIDENSGELSFITMPPVFNGPDDVDDNFYSVQIEASDRGFFENSNTTILDLVVEVVDADVAPTINVSQFNVTPENLSFSRIVTAENPYEDREITLSIEGPDAELFELIDASTNPGFAQAELRLIGEFDFENPTDAGGDNVYNFIIVANDGVSSSRQDVLSLIHI